MGVWIAAKGADAEDALRLIAPVEAEIRARLGGDRASVRRRAATILLDQIRRALPA